MQRHKRQRRESPDYANRFKGLKVGQVVARMSKTDEPIGIIEHKSRGISLVTNVKDGRISSQYMAGGGISHPTITVPVKLRVVIERDNGLFHAYCPQLRGIHVPGKSIEEALQNIMLSTTGFMKSVVKNYNEEHQKQRSKAE